MDYLWVIVSMISPMAEARVGIPLGVSFGITPIKLLVLTASTSVTIYLVYRLLLKVLYHLVLSRWSPFEKLITITRTRGRHLIDRYGYWGLFIFVAIPIPTTGVYSGTLISWYLNLNWFKAFIVVVTGGMASGLIVMVLSLGVKWLV